MCEIGTFSDLLPPTDSLDTQSRLPERERERKGKTFELFREGCPAIIRRTVAAKRDRGLLRSTVCEHKPAPQITHYTVDVGYKGSKGKNVAQLPMSTALGSNI